MGWADCGKDWRGRPIGYAFAAKCDKRGCKKKIDRGLSYVCGGMHGGDGVGCGDYFCGEHMLIPYKKGDAQLCEKCYDEQNPPKKSKTRS